MSDWKWLALLSVTMTFVLVLALEATAVSFGLSTIARLKLLAWVSAALWLATNIYLTVGYVKAVMLDGGPFVIADLLIITSNTIQSALYLWLLYYPGSFLGSHAVDLIFVFLFFKAWTFVFKGWFLRKKRIGVHEL